MSDQLFAIHAPSLARLGLAIIPCTGDDGKKPAVKGFGKWKSPPSLETIAKLADQNPSANIGTLCGLSNIVVVDVDARDQVERIIENFGDSPLKIKTYRGMHIWYRAIPGAKGKDLRKFGIDAEIKAGTHHVLLPPSRHFKGGFYELHDCNWNALKEIPPFPADRLEKLIGSAEQALGSGRSSMKGRVVEGERGLTLNDRLCRQAAFCDSFEDLMDVAEHENLSCIPPLEDSEVRQRSEAVWSDFKKGKIQRFIGRASTVRTTANEMKQFLFKGGTECSWFLLQFLKSQHTPRVRRGETFRFVPAAMFREKCLPGWSERKYHYHLQKLISLGEIEKVLGRRHENGKWQPCEYSFSDV